MCSVNETVNGLCQVWLRVRMGEAIAQARDLLFTTRRNRVKCVKYICMKLPNVAQQVGNAYFYRLTEIKELSGSLWWMHEGRNLLKLIAGCGLFSHVDLTGVVRHSNLGFRAWSRIRVISFRYHGFPYSMVGDFLDPNIRVIRGPYCIDSEVYYCDLLTWSYVVAPWPVRSHSFLCAVPRDLPYEDLHPALRRTYAGSVLATCYCCLLRTSGGGLW